MMMRFAGEMNVNEQEPILTRHTDTDVRSRAEARRSLVVAVLVLVAGLLPLLQGFRQPAKAMDEGSLLVYPELILKGKLPYRDFETFYGPANIYALSAAYAIFGSSISVERGTGLIYRLAILAAVY